MAVAEDYRVWLEAQIRALPSASDIDVFSVNPLSDPSITGLYDVCCYVGDPPVAVDMSVVAPHATQALPRYRDRCRLIFHTGVIEDIPVATGLGILRAIDTGALHRTGGGIEVEVDGIRFRLWDE